MAFDRQAWGAACAQLGHFPVKLDTLPTAGAMLSGAEANLIVF